MAYSIATYESIWCAYEHVVKLQRLKDLASSFFIILSKRKFMMDVEAKKSSAKYIKAAGRNLEKKLQALIFLNVHSFKTVSMNYCYFEVVLKQASQHIPRNLFRLFKNLSPLLFILAQSLEQL